MTQPVSFAPNQLIKQGAKLVTNGEDVIEELPRPVRAALVQAERPEAEQRTVLLCGIPQRIREKDLRFAWCRTG